jgi:MFS family permease
VLIFFLPLYLQNAHGFSALQAGAGMAPFALPMVLAPALSGRLAVRYCGRALLTVGLAITCVGDLLLAVTAWRQVSYGVFVVAMLVAGSGAGLLNGQTVRVLGGAVPPSRAGMASGLASTTRFIGILVSVAVLGAILSAVVSQTFMRRAQDSGISVEIAHVAVEKVTAGNVMQAVEAAPEVLRPQLLEIAQGAFGQGFAAAAAVAALVAAVSAALTFRWVSDPREAGAVGTDIPCKAVDCRDPL